MLFLPHLCGEWDSEFEAVYTEILGLNLCAQSLSFSFPKFIHGSQCLAEFSKMIVIKIWLLLMIPTCR